MMVLMPPGTMLMVLTCLLMLILPKLRMLNWLQTLLSSSFNNHPAHHQPRWHNPPSPAGQSYSGTLSTGCSTIQVMVRRGAGHAEQKHRIVNTVVCNMIMQ